MKLTECPRDAWQGHSTFIPTDKKAAYLNQLLKVGFDTIDFGSFVSPKAMPQVRDTAALLEKLDTSTTTSKLLAIVANELGAEHACSFEKINCIGFPFSISETFQRRNTNSTIAESLIRVERITEICDTHQKELILYLSMGFGNPYGDPWNENVVLSAINDLSRLGIKTFSLSDTVGMAQASEVENIFKATKTTFPEIAFGAHFHARSGEWRSKIEAAYRAGCRRFDGALLGYGGCPMAQDEMVGNIPSEHLIAYALEKGEYLDIDLSAVGVAVQMFQRLIADSPPSVPL
jgi:hydroxymethylglutaryl-CoA lyase